MSKILTTSTGKNAANEGSVDRSKPAKDKSIEATSPTVTPAVIDGKIAGSGALAAKGIVSDEKLDKDATDGEVNYEKLKLIDYHRSRIVESHDNSYDAIMVTANRCLEARNAVQGFEGRLTASLPFGPSVFSMYCLIARNAKHFERWKGQVPANYSTMYQIAKSDGPLVVELIKENKINSSSTREQVRTAVKKAKSLIKKMKEFEEIEREEKEKADAEAEAMAKYRAYKTYAIIRFTDKPLNHKDQVALDLIIEKACAKYHMELWAHSTSHLREAVLEKYPDLELIGKATIEDAKKRAEADAATTASAPRNVAGTPTQRKK